MDTEITSHSSSLRNHRDEGRSSVTARKLRWEIQVSQSRFSSWESYGVSTLGMPFSGHIEKKVSENSQHGFAKGKSFLTNPIAFYTKMTSFNDERRAGDVIYLKAFNTASLQVRRLQAVSSGGQPDG